ncbi:MAG: hypothetical protein IIZ74_00905, partial [Erysipelotrichaceae bacterium]|nr:hypothetical protein [Erysipelotrichaceae bacterium]
AGVNNIDKYQQAYQEGRALERLPHLIIVTDEFAELKKEEPEFMNELNSVATVGRSLGIHMLLATQKPGGVVNDQINANSRFRICMKVQDAADSREMLKRPDAAKITMAGRAYIRVGEDELFELFQSFYSGAAYTGNALEQEEADNKVRIVTVEGSRVEFNHKHRRTADTVDELSAVIGEINRISKAMGITKMRGPWLPELSSWIPLESLKVSGGFNGEAWPDAGMFNTENRVHDGNSVRKADVLQVGRSVDPDAISVPIGMYDIPQQQAQGVQMLNITDTGHFAIYGSPSSGKTTMLKTILLSLGLYYTPKEVSMYVLDAGNWSLNEFAQMPHVREVILNQEERKINDLAISLRREMERRKKLFLANSVSSLAAYRRSVSDDMEAIIVLIDNIVPLFDQYMNLEEVITDIAASGLTYGMYVIYTANSTTGIKYKLTQLVKGAITLQMADKGDYSGIVGAISNVSLPTVPGSALMRGNPPVAFQTAMYIDEKDDQLRHDRLLKLIEAMNRAWNGKDDSSSDGSAGGSSEAEDLMKEYADKKMIPVGRDNVFLKPVYTDMTEGNVFTVSYADERQGINVMMSMAEMLASREDNKVYLIDIGRKCAALGDSDSFRERASYITDEPEDVLSELEKELNERLTEFNSVRTQGEEAVEAWRKTKQQICLIMVDADRLEGNLSSEALRAFGRIFTKASPLGVAIIISAEAAVLNDSENHRQLLSAAHKVSKGLAVGGLP